VYFGLASCLTVVAVCTGGSGGIARSTPFLVRITELAYGALLPAAWISMLLCFAVEYAHRIHCVSRSDTSSQIALAVLAGCGWLAVLLDTAFSRQPYYASFHSIVGMIFCWSWLIFSALYELLGGTDVYGHSYIYRCLDWSYPLQGGLYNAEGKLLILDFFLVVPIFNWLYWLLIWAKRRTLALALKKTNEPLTSPLTAAPRPPTERRILFEYKYDYRDLALDGRHWRAQFGGSSSPKAPKMGAYICCDATFYPGFRLVLAGFAIAVLALRIGEYEQQHASWPTLFLYFENWVLVLAAVYFTLAALLTVIATFARGAESSMTPIFVWLVWAAYGGLLPAALCNAIVWPFLVTGFTLSGISSYNEDAINQLFDLVAVYGIFLVTLLDAWINRQPYYATFHSFVGAAVVWGYLIFSIVWVALGYTNDQDEPYLYRAMNWKQSNLDAWITPGKLVVIEVFGFIPIFNALYWCMLWARRRARVAAKQSAI